MHLCQPSLQMVSTIARMPSSRRSLPSVSRSSLLGISQWKNERPCRKPTHVLQAQLHSKPMHSLGAMMDRDPHGNNPKDQEDSHPVQSSLVRAVSVPPSTRCSMGSGLGSTIELFIFLVPKDARILDKDGNCPLHIETNIPGEKVGRASCSLVSQKTLESWMKMATIPCPACV
jgi:hypothetical protein